MSYRVLKLNGFASVLRPGYWICLAIFYLFFIALALFQCDGNSKLLFFYLAWSLLFPLICLICVALLNTRKIKLDHDDMEFIFVQSVPTSDGRRGTKRVRVTYVVTEIKNLNFDQNKLEKLFNCGHFSFEGNTVYETDSDCIVPKTSFTFYGLTHFRQTKKEICDILGVAEVYDEG